MTVNSKVKTPIGEGISQGRFGNMGGETPPLLVRLPINDETSAHKQDSNCVTPQAHQSGLWLFTENELA